MDRWDKPPAADTLGAMAERNAARALRIRSYESPPTKDDPCVLRPSLPRTYDDPLTVLLLRQRHRP